MTDNPFEKVLDRLREKEWLKGQLGGLNGPNCINGALFFEEVWENGKNRDSLALIILEQYPERLEKAFFSVPAFNNHPDTTFSDVERVLEKAAVKWEEERVTR